MGVGCVTGEDWGEGGHREAVKQIKIEVNIWRNITRVIGSMDLHITFMNKKKDKFDFDWYTCWGGSRALIKQYSDHPSTSTWIDFPLPYFHIHYIFLPL